MLWYIVIHMFMVLSSVLPMEVFVSNPVCLKLDTVQMKAEKLKDACETTTWPQGSTIHAGTAL